jgi:hypothetical protein
MAHHYYIGVKQVLAWPEKHADGRDGYAVKYEDGYTSWSPKETFERAYLPMGEARDGTSINEDMVQAMISELDGSKLGLKTALVHGHLVNGLEVVGTSACLDPADYDQEIGNRLAEEKIVDQVRAHLGFVLAWARNGLQN